VDRAQDERFASEFLHATDEKLRLAAGRGIPAAKSVLEKIESVL
jgi:hypothetical protein